jgi:hypothetical protein
MGTPVAPLYKALRESGLGESVISDGLETVLQQVNVDDVYHGMIVFLDFKKRIVVSGDLLRRFKGCC